LDRGLRIQEVLKQPQYVPMPLAEQVLILYAVTNGFLDDVELRKVKDFERDFLRAMRDGQPGLWQQVQSGARMDKETMASLDQAIKDFKASVAY